jgi:YbbR domain-containing protein
MSWHRPLTQNLGIKIVALLLALALYAHVVTERPVETVLYFPVVIDGLADTLALSEDPPAQVGAKVRATGKQLIRLRLENPPVHIDLSGMGVGTFQKALAPADFKLAGEDIEVLSPADPASYSVQLERRGRRDLPVSVRIEGEPARGYLVGGAPEVRPELVQISGPESWVTQQEGIATAALDVTGQRAQVEAVLALEAPPPWATVTPGSVLVRVPIEPVEEGEASVRPSIVGLRGEGFTAQLDPPDVRLRWSAPQSAANNATAHLRVLVDVERRGRGRYVLPVRVEGPGSEFVHAVVPESVAVTLH